MDRAALAEQARVSRWLCRTEAERRRWVDMGERSKTARLVMCASACLTGLYSSIWFGWWMVAVVVAGGVAAVALDLPGNRRPATGASVIALVQLVIAVGAAGSGGAHSPFLALAVLPVMLFPIRFRTGVAACGVALSLVLNGAAVVVAEMLPPAPQPPLHVYVVSFVALLAGVMAAGLALLSAEVQNREDAVVDPLTGLFNRTSLPRRFAEVAAQARLLDRPVAVAVLDLDHFKTINDTYGHDRGDVVLREVAQTLRWTLRTFDLVYRMGGEEFAVVLPGIDLPAAARLLEQVTADVAGRPAAGLSVTMSAGVTCGYGEALDLPLLLKAADLALYEAKGAGRARVRCAAPSGRPHQPAGTPDVAGAATTAHPHEALR